MQADEDKMRISRNMQNLRDNIKIYADKNELMFQQILDLKRMVTRNKMKKKENNGYWN